MADTEKFQLVIVTPTSMVVDEQVSYVSAPGVEGEFGVMPGHTDYLTLLKSGEIAYKIDKEEKYISVSWGYAEVKANSVVILAENAEHAEQIDLARAEANRAELQAELDKINLDDDAYNGIKAKLERAEARISVAGRLTPSS